MYFSRTKHAQRLPSPRHHQSFADSCPVPQQTDHGTAIFPLPSQDPCLGFEVFTPRPDCSAFSGCPQPVSRGLCHTRSRGPGETGPSSEGPQRRSCHDREAPGRLVGDEFGGVEDPIPGRSWSSPVTWGPLSLFPPWSIPGFGTASKGLYFGGDRPGAAQIGHQWRVIGLDLATGSIAWDRTVHRGVPKRPFTSKSSYGAETPVTDGERIYALFGGVGVFALTTAGEPVWSRPLDPV